MIIASTIIPAAAVLAFMISLVIGIMAQNFKNSSLCFRLALADDWICVTHFKHDCASIIGYA